MADAALLPEAQPAPNLATGKESAPDAPEPAAIPWADMVLAVLGLRLLLTLVGAGIVLLLPAKHQGYSLTALLLGPWRHFDAIWFTGIAAHGYQPGLGTAYLPLYPALVRLMAVVTFGHYLTAALLVSNLACVAGVGLFWRWVADGHGTKVAWRAVAILLLFPDSFYLLGAYSESLFLALSAGCLVAAGRKRWLFAGILATLATLTRLQGLVLAVPILLALWPERRAIRQVLLGLLAAVLPGLALLAYQRVLTARVGGSGIVDTFQRQWHIPLQAPWQTLWRYVEKIRSPEWHLIDSPQANYVLLWDLLIALAVLAVLAASYRRIGLGQTVYGLAAWCFALTRWYSTGRYMLAVLPFFIGVAIWAEERRRFRRLTTASLLLLVFFAAEFAQNSWVD